MSLVGKTGTYPTFHARYDRMSALEALLRFFLKTLYKLRWRPHIAFCEKRAQRSSRCFLPLTASREKNVKMISSSWMDEIEGGYSCYENSRNGKGLIVGTREVIGSIL